VTAWSDMVDILPRALPGGPLGQAPFS